MSPAPAVPRSAVVIKVQLVIAEPADMQGAPDDDSNSDQTTGETVWHNGMNMPYLAVILW